MSIVGTSETKTYQQDRITFIIIGDKIIIRTSFGQQFYLLPRQHYWVRRLNMIRRLITINEIRNLNELASFTNPGIEWVSTSRKYLVDKPVENV